MTARDVGSWFRKALSIQVLIAFILGLVVGLVVLGWWAWPVQWTNADPSDLRLSHKDAYLQLVAESYALSGNSEFARARLEALKKPEEQDVDLSAMIEAAAQIRGEAGKTEDAIRLRRLVTTLNLPVAGTTPQPTARPTSQATSGGTSGVARALGVLFFLALLAAGIMVLFTQLQKREPRRRRPSFAPPEPLPPEEEPQVQALPADGALLAQFEAQYKAGDEAYDVSFGLETASEEFLGECGISALDRTLGEPGRFAAFDLWLFDKLEAHTETRLLLSEQVAADPTLRAKLPDRGEPIQAAKGKVITLETENLRLYVTITELEYEDPSNTIFSRLSTKLEIVRNVKNN